MSHLKPRDDQVGKIDHCEQDLIDNVLIDEWLGQKTPVVNGENGRSLKGEIIYSKVGRDNHLKFVSKSVQIIVDEHGIERLYAKLNGAVNIQNNKILVDSHLVIQGDEDYNAGHIDYDGYVTIKGTVQDKFNVTATYDISIDIPMGIGGNWLY